MNTYELTFSGGSVIQEDASDMRALLTVNDCVYGRPEPVKVEKVQA